MRFGRLERPRGSQPMSEINMTPLIDVMLVLLVIFMLTAPLIGARLHLRLPSLATKDQSPSSTTVVTIALSADGRTWMDGQELPKAAWADKLKPLLAHADETEIELQADAQVPYERVAGLIDVLQGLGLKRIAFVSAATGRGHTN